MPGSASKLRRTVILIGAPVAVVVIRSITVLTTRSTTVEMERSIADGLIADAIRASNVVAQYLNERRSDVEFLAQIPQIVSAARRASDEVDQRGLVRFSLQELERRFEINRTLGAGTELGDYLRRFRDQTDLAEVFFTERNGFNVEATNRTSGFVQSDEVWWQRAMADGSFQGDPAADVSAGAVALDYSVAITDPEDGARLGVLKGVIDLSPLARLLNGGRRRPRTAHRGRRLPRTAGSIQRQRALAPGRGRRRRHSQDRTTGGGGGESRRRVRGDRGLRSGRKRSVVDPCP